jgi:hypothetical protein
MRNPPTHLLALNPRVLLLLLLAPLTLGLVDPTLPKVGNMSYG